MQKPGATPQDRREISQRALKTRHRAINYHSFDQFRTRNYFALSALEDLFGYSPGALPLAKQFWLPVFASRFRSSSCPTFMAHG